MLIDEKIYKAERNVKYVFEKQSNSNILLVVFSGLQKRGNPPRYNFINTLKAVECNKLFILDDFGSRGSYYLSINDNDFIEESIMELIDDLLDEIGLSRKNVISIGSSKGGYSALYYAFKYKFGEVIAGSPSFYIINSLKKHKNYDVIDFLTANATEEEVNNKLKNVILNASEFPRINIMVGNKEYYYFNHVKYLVDILQKKNVKYYLEFRNFEQHNDLIKHFPTYMKKTVLERTKNIKFNSIQTTYGNVVQGSELFFKIDCEGEDLSYAWYLYKGNEVIKKHWYTDDNIIKWRTSDTGVYRILFFVRDKQGNKISRFSDKINVISQPVEAQQEETV